METGYIIGIVVIAVVVVAVAAWLLRGRFSASAVENKIEAGIRTAVPEPKRRPGLTPTPGKRSAMTSRTAPMANNQVMNLWRHGVNFARNRLMGKPHVEVKQQVAGPAPAARRTKRRRKK